MADNDGSGSDGTDRSGRSVRSRHRHLRPSGGYRQLRSFQVATLVYDATVSFCARFLDKRSRLVDQMVQAARSGRQNIAEGSRAAATSSQTELRLVNVARASLDELLLDYEDFLRQRRKRQWEKNDAEAQAVRAMARRDRMGRTDPFDSGPYATWLAHRDSAVVANAAICLIHQANYLLDRQIAGLERDFIGRGGYSERLAAARLEQRRRGSSADTAPECPLCGQPMVVRTAGRGKRSGSQFWAARASRSVEAAESFPDRTDRPDLSDRSDENDPKGRFCD
jgi:restriction system protein